MIWGGTGFETSIQTHFIISPSWKSFISTITAWRHSMVRTRLRFYHTIDRNTNFHSLGSIRSGYRVEEFGPFLDIISWYSFSKLKFELKFRMDPDQNLRRRILHRWNIQPVRVLSLGLVHTFFHRQLGCLAFSLRFWPKIKQFFSN